MAKSDKLINYAYLKEECDLPQNLTDEELEHQIYRAQEMLRMVIGDEFYQDFKTNYKNNTLSVPYGLLYNPYIKQFVAWQAKEYWIFSANYKPTRSGMRIHTDETSAVPSDVQMASLIKDAKQTSQYYKKLMIDFLKGNSTRYPLYDNCCNDVAGNSFHISAVKNKQHGHNCKCNRCHSW